MKVMAIVKVFQEVYLKAIVMLRKRRSRERERGIDR